MSDEGKLTPLMRQYFAIKEQYPNTLLLFQVGDFFELFFDDAVTAASCLHITLTKRGMHQGQPIPLCGVPLHALNTYLGKLVKAGHHVAICEQLEPPQPGKVVKRGVTRVLTPGTLTDAQLLDDKTASYFFSCFPRGDQWGLLFGELLTAQLFATTLPAEAYRSLDTELARFFPDEILLPQTQQGKQLGVYLRKNGYAVTHFATNEGEEAVRGWLRDRFDEATAKALEQQHALCAALTNFYYYFQTRQAEALDQFHSLQLYEPEDYLLLDPATQQHLELVKNSYDGTRKNTIVELLDYCVTPMGSRMLRKWLMRPLVCQQTIQKRQDAVEVLVGNLVEQQQLRALFRQVADIERVVGRIALGRAVVNDFLQLKESLGVVPHLREWLVRFDTVSLFQSIGSWFVDFRQIYHLLAAALHDDSEQGSWIIKAGFDEKLDHMRELVTNTNQKLLALEQREQKRTGIASLKVRYNNVHGYYIEVTKPNLHLVPEQYMPQQTLVGKQRFTTEELRALQVEIEQARHEITTREQELFEQVKLAVQKQVGELRRLAHALANLDCLLGIATAAYEHGYVRPGFNESRAIRITDGRHPIVERVVDQFIANDTNLTDEQSLWILTGPNMGGKSTYLRQVAVICVLAHIGSFVPAKAASISLLDRIFTRIGASDQLAKGKSTFLVEMEETATICRQATKNSLVILDEVGRGTSTFDGLAIAQAVVEYLHQHIGARCLFATHYHELTALEQRFNGIVSYHATCRRTGRGLLFLHKILRGAADGSFGIEVARFADLPEWIVARSRTILCELAQHGAGVGAPIVPVHDERFAELDRYRMLQAKLAKLDLDETTPRGALDFLWCLKKEYTEKGS